MKKFLILLFYVFCSNLFGQSNDSLKPINVADINPEYIGGFENLANTIEKNLIYPIEAKKNKIEGTVFVSVIIDSLGKINEIKVVRGVSEELNQEAIRIVGLLGEWTPGISKGRKVNSQCFLPIKFRLPEK